MNSKKKKILCVAEKSKDIKFLQSIFVGTVYETYTAKRCQGVLQKLRDGKIDLVLFDLDANITKELALCEKIKTNEEYRDIPVVMIVSADAKNARVKAIHLGAEELIVKPFDNEEVLMRIDRILHVKDLSSKLQDAYNRINSLTYFGENIINTFDPHTFDFISKVDSIVQFIIRKPGYAIKGPKEIIVGIRGYLDMWHWYEYKYADGDLPGKASMLDLEHSLNFDDNTPKIILLNKNDLEESEMLPLIKRLRSYGIKTCNMIGYMSHELCIFALNYGQPVTENDAAVLNSLVMQGLLLNFLSKQMRSTEGAFEYTVQALSRASEANDEDTGNHILRVGEYCSMLAEELGMSSSFVQMIKLQSQLHDVGKIHVPPEILRKPGGFSDEEWESMQKHTVYGAKILGNHPKLNMAKKMALCHHEKWDGSGYPNRMKNEQIPIEARIMCIADQYDALRKVRPYKPAYTHTNTLKIIVEGDGRTKPSHFDPCVLKAFKKLASRFESTYEQLNDL